MTRPDWMPEGWAYTRASKSGRRCSRDCDGRAVNWADNLPEKRVVYWCDDCSDRAKAAICGGDE